jgi:hypothetical protein
MECELIALVFDEGVLKADQKRSQIVIDSLMANMLDKTYTKQKSAVVQAHDDIFRRVSQVSFAPTALHALFLTYENCRTPPLVMLAI